MPFHHFEHLVEECLAVRHARVLAGSDGLQACQLLIHSICPRAFIVRPVDMPGVVFACAILMSDVWWQDKELVSLYRLSFAIECIESLTFDAVDQDILVCARWTINVVMLCIREVAHRVDGQL